MVGWLFKKTTGKKCALVYTTGCFIDGMPVLDLVYRDDDVRLTNPQFGKLAYQNIMHQHAKEKAGDIE